MAATTSNDAATTMTMSSVIDELDHAIAENLQGLTGAIEVDAETEESLIMDLRAQLQQQFLRHGDVAFDEITLEWIRTVVPLPAWVPRTLTNAIGETGSITASEALSQAIQRPRQTNIKSLASAVERAVSASQQGGSEKSFTPPPSEPARPSGLTSAGQIGAMKSGPTSAPSTSTTLLAPPVAEPHVSLLKSS